MRIGKHGMWAGLLLLAAGLTACIDGPYVEGSGNSVEEVRETPDFKALDVSEGLTATVVVDPEQLGQVRVVGDDNLVALVRTEVWASDTLHVDFRPGEVGDWHSRNPLRVEVTVPRLEALTRSGGGTVDVQGRLDSESFTLTASGGGRIRVVGLATARLELATSGGTELYLEGEATEVDSAMSGGGTLRAEGLSAREASLESSGGGSAVMRVSDSLWVSASGGGEVRILGRPTVLERALSGGSALTLGGRATAAGPLRWPPAARRRPAPRRLPRGTGWCGRCTSR